MTFNDHFSALASHFAAFRPRYPGSLFEFLAGLCARHDRVWDCACGNGQASVDLAGHFDSVVATDASAEQIREAKAHSGIVYRVAQAEHSGLQATSVDLVTVAQALHWFNLDSFYHEVTRVLRADGVLAVWCYGVVHVEGAKVDPLVQTFYYEVVGPYWPHGRQYVEDGYRSLTFPYSPIEVPRFTMEAQWPLAHFLGFVRSWSATGRYIQRYGVDPVATLEEQLERVWGDPGRERRITWPLSLRVGRKQ
jgi:SAM-dependent methyltransferase